MAKPKTHIRKDDQNPENSVGGLRRTLCGLFIPREQLDKRQSVVPEMPPVPQKGPLTRKQGPCADTTNGRRAGDGGRPRRNGGNGTTTKPNPKPESKPG